jgi:hypothetical protein
MPLLMSLFLLLEIVADDGLTPGEEVGAASTAPRSCIYLKRRGEKDKTVFNINTINKIQKKLKNTKTGSSKNGLYCYFRFYCTRRFRFFVLELQLEFLEDLSE